MNAALASPATFTPASAEDRRLAQARWSRVPLAARLRCIAELRHLLAEDCDGMAKIAAAVGRRPVAEKIVSEVLPLADACRWLETEAGRVLAPRRCGSGGRPFWLRGVTFEVQRQALGAVLVIVALMVSFESFATDIRAGDAPRGQRRLFGFLRDVVFFIPFFFVAWLYRARPEIHKRAMLVATTILLMPAVGRMRFLVEPIALWQFMLLWPIPVYIAMTHDYVHRRIIHPVYILGLVAMLAMRLVLPLRGTETWLAISAWFVGWYE